MTAPKTWPTRTADGRDLFRVEWRTIPGFRKYQITRDGDVRNRVTRRILTEYQNQRTGAYSYTLWRDDGTKTSRNYTGLVKAAWETEAAPDGAASIMSRKPQEAP